MSKITNPPVFRENVRNKLKEIFEDETLAINMEKGIFNYTIKEANNHKIVKKWENPLFSQIYTDHLRSIYINLKNTDLLIQIKNREIEPQTCAFMTHQEYSPEKWTESIKRKIIREKSKYTINTEASTDVFICRKCKSHKCTYYEMQTRSADEPSTIFITCLDCGKHWKN